MNEKKQKQANGDSETTYAESQVKEDAILKDIKLYVEREFSRQNAIIEEINSYTDGKQIILTNSNR